ncbi:MAG TPA: tryptophan synthase subunit alpha, partial [Steroidobacteraceae bacterium]
MSMADAGTPTERIVAALRGAAKQGQPALVAFLTAGYPSRAQFREHLSDVAQEADVVEIGVPFSDPMADGVTIQRSSEAALRNGVTLTWLLEELQLMPAVKAPLLLMSYMNPLLAFGL